MGKVTLALLMLLAFSGCGGKQISIEKICDMERPERKTPKEAICGGIKDTKEREMCTASKYLSLEQDWDIREAYIDACIK